MEANSSNSKRFVWIVIGIAIVACVVVSVVLYMLFGAPTNEETANTSEKETTTQTVATEEDVQTDLDNIDEALKEAESDQDDARTAISDSKTQTKVGD